MTMLQSCNPPENISTAECNYSDFFNSSALHTNESRINIPEVTSSDSTARVVNRFLNLIICPILIIFGNYGNAVSFYIMRRGSLKKVSTCFYMAILALADIREYTLN